jgi:type II secretory pathway component PulF
MKLHDVYEELAAILEAGMPLPQALRELGTQRGALHAAAVDVEQGVAVAEALTRNKV